MNVIFVPQIVIMKLSVNFLLKAYLFYCFIYIES